MASYISQHQGNNYDVVKPYEPDFSWMSGVLSTKENQYEKGLSEIASGYSSIVNQPLSDYENLTKRKEYINAAQEGLKKITTQDLSKDKNVRQAEALYAPFWEDEYMLRDSAYTKYIEREKQRAQSAKYSKEEGIRKTYSEESVEMLDWQLNRLKNAKRDENVYRELDWEGWVPVTNVQDVLDSHKIADKFEVVTDVRDGKGTIVQVKNGPGSISNYKVYGDGILGNNYNAQYKMKAKLSKERQIATYMHCLLYTSDAADE